VNGYKQIRMLVLVASMCRIEYWHYGN